MAMAVGRRREMVGAAAKKATVGRWLRRSGQQQVTAAVVGDCKKMRKRIQRGVLRWPRRTRLGVASIADEGRRMVTRAATVVWE
ncbi:hypothetical protein GW17_00042062 [Ensete ventricosum]|nr:hypothetical protein GW17_00042062 [Ensete ventricosum]